MRADAILDVLTAVDAKHATDEWLIGDVHALPLFRYEVHTRNYDLYQRTGGPPPSRLAGLASRARDAAGGGRPRVRPAPGGRRADAPRRGPVDAVLYSDGVSFVERLGKQYDRYLDPLKEQLERVGATSLMLTPIDTYLVPRYSPSVFLQPRIDVAHAKARIKSRLGKLPPARMPGYDEVLRSFTGVALPSMRHLQRVMLYTEEFAALYTKLLKKLRPRVVYIVAYYGSERFAMMLAAHRLGIPTVDIQHGYSGELHWGYARWSRIPAGGYALLPRYFWCWTEEDYKSMSAWTGRSRGAHHTLLGGILLQEMWKERSSRAPLEDGDRGDGLVAVYDTRVHALFARHHGQRGLLYTASGFETDEQLALLGRAITETAGELFWYVRMHPCRLDVDQRIASGLRAAGAVTFDIENATSLPLYALLRHVAVHLTESSSTVVEAAAFGVPTVLWGTLETESFASYVASGWALPAEPADVPAALRTQLRARAALPYDPEVAIPRGLPELLALARPAASAA
jgi:hypothetical protein